MTAASNEVIYISGDTWNVNPIALKRIERLFCKNERAVVRTKLAANGRPVTLVAVAAILVASIRLHCLDGPLNLQHRGPNVIACDADSAKAMSSAGSSTARPSSSLRRSGFALCDNVREGARIRVGRAADAAALIDAVAGQLAAWCISASSSSRARA